MELKCYEEAGINPYFACSNRTFMELKLPFLCCLSLFLCCSNRTFMELKSAIWMHVQWDMEF